MSWDPSQPIRGDLLDFKLQSRLFIESEETTVDDRAGWATPRKRPRRIYKKLAARCFVAKCRQGQPFPGSGVTKCRRWHGRAPKLAVWLRGSNPPGVEWAHQGGSVRFDSVMFDGNTLAKPPYPDAVLSTGRVWVETRVGHDVFPRAGHGPIGPLERQAEEWRGQTVGCDYRVQRRPLPCSAVIFAPPDVRADHHVVSAPMERAMEQITRAMLSAAQGEHETKIIARQTSYRPNAVLSVIRFALKRRGGRA